jgi:hypothetical protein
MIGSVLMVAIAIMLFAAGRRTSRGVAMQGAIELQEDAVLAAPRDPGEVFVV